MKGEKRKKSPPQCLIWVDPQIAKAFSSTTGALVGAGSLKPTTRRKR
jgi:hypothetical protein